MLSGQVEQELETALLGEELSPPLCYLAQDQFIDYEEAIAYSVEAIKRDAPRRRVRANSLNANDAVTVAPTDALRHGFFD